MLLAVNKTIAWLCLEKCVKYTLIYQIYFNRINDNKYFV